MFGNFFGNNDSAPATATPAPSTPAATPSPAAPGAIPDGVDPNAAAPAGVKPTPVEPVKPTEPKSPLDAFAEIWDTDPNKTDTSVAPEQLDPVKLKELLSKTDFSTVISPENLAAIAEGGEPAQAAFSSSMNQVAQAMMNQTLLASNKMVEQAVNQVNTAWETKIPELLKAQNLSDNLVDNNPLYKNPAVKPVMEAAQAALRAKNPEATAGELAVMTKDFIKVMGEAFAPAPVVTKPGEDNQDWDIFVTGEPQS